MAAALRALDQDIEKEETAPPAHHLRDGQGAGDGGSRLHSAARAQVARASGATRSPPWPRRVTPPRIRYVAEALADPDENVRIRALLLCAGSGVGGEKIIPRAIQIVSKDARGAPPQVVRAAIEVVVRRWEAGTLALPEAEIALCRLAAPIGFFGRLFGQTPPPATVLVTAIAAIGRLGTDQATNLLQRLKRSRDPDVAQAAQA